MDIRETVSVAIDALRSNKLRAILTSLGVIIGSASIVLVVTVEALPMITRTMEALPMITPRDVRSASIVLVVTVALTSKQFVLSQIESIGSNLIQVELVTR